MTSSNKLLPPMAMRPAGPFGRPFAAIMEAMNAGSYRETLAALSPRQGDSLLEIGFGTGAFLKLAARRMKSGLLTGVDPSSLMVGLAKRKLSRHSKQFEINLSVGDDESVASSGPLFNSVVAIHSFQFWRAPETTLTRLYHRMTDGGVVCLTLRRHGARPPVWLPNPISRSADETTQTLSLLHSSGYYEAKCYKSTRASDFLIARKR